MVSLVLLSMAGCVVIGFMSGTWWALLAASLPLATGAVGLAALVAGLLALGVAAAKRRGLWVRWRGERAHGFGDDRPAGIRPDRFDASRR